MAIYLLPSYQVWHASRFINVLSPDRATRKKNARNSRAEYRCNFRADVNSGAECSITMRRPFTRAKDLSFLLRSISSVANSSWLNPRTERKAIVSQNIKEPAHQFRARLAKFQSPTRKFAHG